MSFCAFKSIVLSYSLFDALIAMNSLDPALVFNYGVPGGTSYADAVLAFVTSWSETVLMFGGVFSSD